MKIKAPRIGHRSHQNGVKRWCRIDRNLSKDTRLIASKLDIKYLV